VLASAYGIQAAARLRSEEVAQRAEPLLATGVTRSRWLASHVLIALAGCALLLTITGCAAGLALAAQGGSPGAGFGALLGAALVQVPAAWVLTCIAVAVFGVAPRAVVAAWGALVAFLLLGEFGTVLGLAPAVQDLSPYAHVPPLPGGDFSATPVVGLSVVAAALLAAGVAGFRRRDIG